ncbi:MAG: response regulator [Anaerolineales bacterium]|nr:response regulator [Anaerolineales bacterium]
MPTSSPNVRARILYMEDDATSALLFRRRLERDGYHVDIAVDGEAGLALLADAAYDLVALDYHMPKLDGLGVLQVLAGQIDTPPVIMITSENDTQTVLEAMRLGAYDYLIKAPNSGHLLLLPGVIERSLAKRRLEVEQRRTIEELHTQNREIWRSSTA